MAGPLRVLIAGAGVAGLEATLALRVLAEDRVEIEVVAPEEDFVYRPMSVAAPFRRGEVRRFPTKRLVELAGGRLTAGALTSIDLDARRGVTGDGVELEWDVLLLAPGADAREGVPGALTFRGPESTAALKEVIDDALAGRVRSIGFALPTLAAWPMPLYELALMAQSRLSDAGAGSTRLTLVTPENTPLTVFGRKASESISELLAVRGVAVRARTTPVAFRDGFLELVPGGALAVDQVVALPILVGRAIDGLDQDARGFVRTDLYGRVEDRTDVYAAGDVTTFPIKQGGIATQQADAAAASIAALAGAPAAATPFKPVLRGLLLTGLTPEYMRSDLLSGEIEIDSEPLWWPPAKIVGRHLAPFLAKHLALAEAPPRPTRSPSTSSSTARTQPGLLPDESVVSRSVEQRGHGWNRTRSPRSCGHGTTSLPTGIRGGTPGGVSGRCVSVLGRNSLCRHSAVG
jgi:sulfide:quinone oxidoreductase